MAFDAFLKLDAMEGESTDDKYRGWVEIESYGFGVSHLTTIGSATGGAGSGKTAVGELKITKVVDKSSAVLFQKCCTGEHFAKGRMVVRKAAGVGGQIDFLTYAMENVFVTSLQVGSQSDECPVESLSLAYGRVGFDYHPQKLDGSQAPAIHGGWDQIANKKY
jgi:type VI secretion system secreted protein Hcp